MVFNTNTLGYKLVHGKLKKHSEQLNKYLAGLIDTDGSISFDFIGDHVYLRSGISQSATVDSDFTLLRSLHKHYGIGRITYDFSDDTNVSRCSWRFSTKDTKILYNLIGKHMRVKQTHFRDMIAQQELGGSREYLTQFAKESRARSTWIKRPKHLSYAYVAGLIDGDGCYRVRRKKGIVVSICVKVAMQEDYILGKLQEDFRGSINNHSEGMRCWRRGLGRGHIAFSLPFLKKMREYSCNENKYKKIQEMIEYLQAAETKRLSVERLSDSPTMHQCG